MSTMRETMSLSEENTTTTIQNEQNPRVFRVDNIDMYSFGSLKSMREFVAKNKFAEYESSKPAPVDSATTTTSIPTVALPRYNTRRTKMKKLPYGSESSFSPSSSSSSSYEDKRKQPLLLL